MPHTPELQEVLRERVARTEIFDVSTPDLSPRFRPSQGHQGDVPEGPSGSVDSGRARSPEASRQPPCSRRGRRWIWQWLRTRVAAAVVVAAVAFLCGLSLGRRQEPPEQGDGAPGALGVPQGATSSFEELYGEKLGNLTAGVRSLQGLSQVVVRAEQTYEEVYHEQLVLHGRGPAGPEEREWDGFVQEARRTGPLFLDGKERLRDAVASMHRLIRRAPELLRSLLHWLGKQDADEATWYLGKVASLVDSVHEGMEGAAEKFAAVDAALDGMTRDARESEEHFESRAARLEGEANALEGSPPTRTGSWTRKAEQALYGCQLERTRTSLEDCKVLCVGHATGSCSHLTYYKTSSRSNCYLHCDPASLGSYREADTYVLERAPEELALDVVRKREAGLVALELRRRWRSVREPLREVARLSRRFRTATADLRKSLEDVRFATNDLKATVQAPLPAPEERERRLRLLERRVGEVVAAVNDLSNSLPPVRPQ
uniref:Uncharacterized protein n=1 Tax=Alexandrium monilatum TaxID=311494 RepID=A0A7S4PTA4_9DINO